jgi:hypothetical protein
MAGMNALCEETEDIRGPGWDSKWACRALQAHQPVPPTPRTPHVQVGLSGRSPLKQEPRAVLSACSNCTELPSQHGACHHRPYYCLTTLNQLFYMELRGTSAATRARVRFLSHFFSRHFVSNAYREFLRAALTTTTTPRLWRRRSMSPAGCHQKRGSNGVSILQQTTITPESAVRTTTGWDEVAFRSYCYNRQLIVVWAFDLSHPIYRLILYRGRSTAGSQTLISVA